MSLKQDTPAADRDLLGNDALASAQERLMVLRREFARQKTQNRPDHRSAEAIASPSTNGRTTSGRFPLPSAPGSTPVLHELVDRLPPHLGWGSDRLAAQLRRAAQRQRESLGPTRRPLPPEVEEAYPETSRPSETADFPYGTPRLPARKATDSAAADSVEAVKVFPDIAIAMLRGKHASPGRLWYLLRHIDGDGRGWVATRTAVRLLSANDAPLRICGRRQLSNLLAAGEGLFWERTSDDGGRIWLRSAARVAASLGVGRLGVSPVAVPVSALTASIGTVRAHLFASFHSGRQGLDQVSGQPRPRAPIARATLQTLTTASPNSQRSYERRASIRRKAAFAVGPPAASADAQDMAWRRGRALFFLHDRDGRYGRPGCTYLAWQLPNEYAGPHARLARGRMKRINRALADLLVNGMTGNGERSGLRLTGKRFFGNAKAAALGERKRAVGQELYWRDGDGCWHWWPLTEVGRPSRRSGPGRSPGTPTRRRETQPRLPLLAMEHGPQQAAPSPAPANLSPAAFTSLPAHIPLDRR